MNPDTLVSTRCMLALINESEYAGKNIVGKLHEQSVKSSRDKCPNERMMNQRQPSEKSKSVFVHFKRWFRTSNSSQRELISSSDVVIDDDTTRERPESDTYLGKSFAEMNGFERVIEDELHSIHKGVRRLSELATQMNEELNNQTPSTNEPLKVVRTRTM